MTTAPTIDGVPREVLNRALLDAQRVRFPTDKQVIELHALLDAPAQEQQWINIEAFNRVSTELEELKATRPQGEPVAWQFYQDGKWWNGDDRIKDHRKNTVDAGYKVRNLYAEQPAPVAVVLPERLNPAELEELEVIEALIHGQGLSNLAGTMAAARQFIDEVTRLNPSL